MKLKMLLRDKNSCIFSEKPSCIEELKELSSSLSDRDTLMKRDYKIVSGIIHDSSLTNAQKIKKIKTIIDGGK